MVQINIKLKKAKDLQHGDIIVNIGTVLKIFDLPDFIAILVNQEALMSTPKTRILSEHPFRDFVIYSSNQS